MLKKLLLLLLFLIFAAGCKGGSDQAQTTPQPQAQQPQGQPRQVPNQPRLKPPSDIPLPAYNWQVAGVSTTTQGEGVLVDQGSLRSLGNNQIALWYEALFGIPRNDPNSAYTNIGAVYTYAIADCSAGSLTPKYSVAVDFYGNLLGEVDQQTWGQSFPSTYSNTVNSAWVWVCNR